MNLIIETDLGHDPDDFFTLCWLAAVGVDIRAVLITPGDPDQVAIAEFIREYLNLNYEIGASQFDRTKLSCSRIHREILEAYGSPLHARCEREGGDVLINTLAKFPDAELLVIGPAKNVGAALARENLHIRRATMQGGFLPYHYHPHAKVQLDKFVGKTSVPSFNPNGDRKGFQKFCEAEIEDRRFVSKNICHTVVYDKQVHARLKPHNKAGELFKHGMDILLQRHDSKMFHDPLAAVMHLKSEIGTWVRGRPAKEKDGWTTILDEQGDHVLADMDYEAFWNRILEFRL